MNGIGRNLKVDLQITRVVKGEDEDADDTTQCLYDRVGVMKFR